MENYEFKHIQEDSIKNKHRLLKKYIEDLIEYEKEEAVISHLKSMKKIVEQVEEQFKYYTTHKFKYEERLKELKRKEELNDN